MNKQKGEAAGMEDLGEKNIGWSERNENCER